MRLNFDEEQIRFGLVRLSKKRLIETPHAHYREIEVDGSRKAEEFSYRATSIGIYHIRYWAGDFAFLDAMSIDTPMFDDSARGTVFQDVDSLEIKNRYTRAVAFRKYIEENWHSSNLDVTYYDFVKVISSQKKTFDAVRRHIYEILPAKRKK